MAAVVRPAVTARRGFGAGLPGAASAHGRAPPLRARAIPAAARPSLARPVGRVRRDEDCLDRLPAAAQHGAVAPPRSRHASPTAAWVLPDPRPNPFGPVPGPVPRPTTTARVGLAAAVDARLAAGAVAAIERLATRVREGSALPGAHDVVREQPQTPGVPPPQVSGAVQPPQVMGWRQLLVTVPHLPLNVVPGGSGVQQVPLAESVQTSPAAQQAPPQAKAPPAVSHAYWQPPATQDATAFAGVLAVQSVHWGPHWLPSSFAAQAPAQAWYPAPHTKPQRPPVQR